MRMQAEKGNATEVAATVASSEVTQENNQGFNVSDSKEIQAGNQPSFNFGEHEVRVVVRDGEPWFVASDVCGALDYKNTSKAIGDHLDDDEKGVTTGYTLGGEQKLIVISESGLYALVLRSRKPEARKFAKWVTSEVLPSIRKTGQYTATPYTVQPSDTLNEPQQIALRAMLESNVKRLPHAKQAAAMVKGWSKLKAHFGVPYRQIPAGEFEEALSIIARHVSEWELVDEAPQQPQQDQEIDVAALLLSGQCDPKPLTAAQHMLIDQCAGRLVGEAYPLIRAHLERRVAWNSNAAQQNSAEATQAILHGATLGNCLAHHYRNELQAAHTVMQVVRQRLDAALGSIIQPLGLSH